VSDAAFLANLGPVKTALGLPANWEAQLQTRKNSFTTALNSLETVEQLPSIGHPVCYGDHHLYDVVWPYYPHYMYDPGEPVFQDKKIPQRVSIYKFYLDMHTDEWVQLQYFEFVVKGRKNLHEAMKKLSKLIQARASQQKIDSAWEEVALLYNGKRYKERGYDKLLKAAYKRSPIKGIP